MIWLIRENKFNGGKYVKAFVMLANMLEVITLGLIVTITAVSVRVWQIWPSVVDASRSGILSDKLTLLWLLIIMFSTYFLLSVYMRFYSLYRFPVKIRPYNRQDQQTLLKSFVSFVKFELVLLLFSIIFNNVWQVVIGDSFWSDVYFIVIVFVLIIITAIAYLRFAKSLE